MTDRAATFGTGPRRWAGISVVMALVVAACTPPATSPGSDPPDDPATTATTHDTTPTRSRTSTTTTLAPITGYGDFSGYAYNEFDDVMVMEQINRCVADQGFPITFDPQRGNSLTGDVPPEQMQRLAAVLVACSDGIKLPERPMTRDELYEYYQFFLASAECLRRAGYDIPPAPSFDTWAEAFSAPRESPEGYWQPADHLPDSALGRGIETDGCPLRYRVGWRDMIPPATNP